MTNLHVRRRVEAVLPAFREEYERAVGEPMFCASYEAIVDSPYRSACTGTAELTVDSVPWCRACAHEFADRILSAIEMVDAVDDPRRQATK